MDDSLSHTSESYRRFRQPFDELLEDAQHQRSCSKVVDDAWIDTGLIRVLKHGIFGRDSLEGILNQKSGEAGLSVGQFLDALKCPRQNDHLRVLLDQFLKSATDISTPPLFTMSATTKDARPPLVRLYTDKLRNLTCHHLALCNRKELLEFEPRRTKKRKKTDKSHDMDGHKFLEAKTFPQGTAKGKKLSRLICKDVDQARAALVLDFKERGMLDGNLVNEGRDFRLTEVPGKIVKEILA